MSKENHIPDAKKMVPSQPGGCSHSRDAAGAQIEGMTLRQHYAGLAMAAYIQSDVAQQYTDKVIASLSLKAADALILEQNA